MNDCAGQFYFFKINNFFLSKGNPGPILAILGFVGGMKIINTGYNINIQVKGHELNDFLCSPKKRIWLKPYLSESDILFIRCKQVEGGEMGCSEYIYQTVVKRIGNRYSKMEFNLIFLLYSICWNSWWFLTYRGYWIEMIPKADWLLTVFRWLQGSVMSSDLHFYLFSVWMVGKMGFYCLIICKMFLGYLTWLFSLIWEHHSVGILGAGH